MRQKLFLFLLAFHIIAITIESIPRQADSVMVSLRDAFRPITLPYIQITGQWQNWNLFAPDPAERNLIYFVDVVDNKTRVGSAELSAEAIPMYRRTALLKVMRQMWKEGEEYKSLRVTFLESLCTRWHVPSGAGLRLRVVVEELVDNDDREEVNDVSVTCA